MNRFPFTAVVGQQKLKNALLWNLVNPAVGGILISGEKGTAKSTLIRGLDELMGRSCVVELPLNITEDRLYRSLSLETAIKEGRKKTEEGLLQRAEGRFLYVDEINLLSDHIANDLIEATG